MYFLIKSNLLVIWLGFIEMAYGVVGNMCINGTYKTRDINEGKPIVELQLFDNNIYVDDKIILICNVRASPGAEIFWLYEGMFLRFTTSERKRNMYTYSECNDTLTILSAELQDTGRYSCMAKNSRGETMSKMVTLAVQLKPKYESLYKNALIEILPQRLLCNSTQQNVTLKCRDNDSQGICVWKKENQSINTENYCDDRMCCLTISDFSMDDAGAYTCFIYFDARKATVVIPEPKMCRGNDMELNETKDPKNTNGKASKPKSHINVWIYVIIALIATTSYC